ncbi:MULTISPECIES: amino acid adenylation domain-containing protein [unclassified Corynebacterium]|uniref:amino acid adenylation domain-containing protein n=1 Tax=unclassified Corynebacterium TaxID=2624378 RepID=UPI0029CA4385|nr:MULTISPECIES: amino acid adenylation domain-containing protein [unclassified Corynebacterium]WPF65769.1 amino acid adenylation domain-containing protein [Corynebacterium sp. 22KM0430]WPF68263.1 amino acid adenylation domain-containing protein [Corynebacterium sp. 21KM1197]
MDSSPHPTASARSTVAELLEHTLARTPEAPAVIVDNGETLTYSQVGALSGALARRLIAAGVAPGERVAVVAGRSAWQVIAAVAVLRAGGVYVPVDRAYPSARIAELLGDCAPAVVLHESCGDVLPQGTAPTLDIGDPEIREDIHTEAQAEAAAGARTGSTAIAPARPLTGADPVYIIYTSGTTGKPKGAINLHAGVALHLRWMGEVFGGAEHVVLNKAPMAFDVGVAEMLSPLVTGGAVVIPAADWWPGDSRALLEMIRRHRVTVLSIVPSMVRAMLEAGVRAGEMDSLRHLLLGGEAVPADLVARLREVTPARLHGLYGPSEAAMDVMWVEYTPDIPLCGGQALLGHAEPEVIVEVCQPEGREPVAPGEIGELVIGGPQVGGGYLNRPEATSAAFFTGPDGQRRYRTGDLVRFDEALGMYEFRGRLGDQVKVRGNRVELGEVEAALRAAPGVSGAAARLVGEELWGYVTGASHVAPEVRAHLERELPAYAVPTHLVPLDSLPLSANGKLDRSALPTQR